MEGRLLPVPAAPPATAAMAVEQAAAPSARSGAALLAAEAGPQGWRALRQVVGTAACFLASGLVHELIFW